MSEREVLAWHYATRKPVRLAWREGLLAHVELTSATPPVDQWIAPPLVDLQINGYAGVDFQQDGLTSEDLLTASRALCRSACTRYLLTLVTDDWSRLLARLRHLRALRSSSSALQQMIVGWHIEGPFLSAEPGFCGAHNPERMIDPTPEHIRALRDAAGEDRLLLTLAPERQNAIAAIEQAVQLGMKVSLGHSNASSKRLKQAMRYGATAFTHLGNGCPRDLDRHDNILWRLFELPGLKVSLIPDEIHVSPTLFRLIHRELGGDSIFYVSDAMAAAGAPPGRYKLGALELDVGEDQVVRYPGKPNFAGSALRPLDGVFRAAEMLHGPWQDAWVRFCDTPARFMGLEWEWRSGAPADFCLLEVSPENQLFDCKVFHRGEVVS